MIMKPLPMIPDAAPAAPDSTRTEFAADADKTATLKPAIIDAISTVYDPEIPVNIWELGLIYDVVVDGGRGGTRDDDAYGTRLPGSAVAPGGSGIESPRCCRRDRREGRCRVGTRVDEGSDVRGGEAAAGALVEICIPPVRRGQGSGGRAVALAEAEGGRK